MIYGYAVKVDNSGHRRVDDPEYIDPATEYFLPEAEGPPPTPVPNGAAILAAANAKLADLQKVGTAQVNALKERIEVLNDALDAGDILDEEREELVARQAQLEQWKAYRVSLGRVKSLAGWPISPAWPAAPAALSSDTLS